MGRAEEAPIKRPGTGTSGDGLRNYYLGHIHDLLLQLRVKTHNLHRLEAQRNDLNSKGTENPTIVSLLLVAEFRV
jgi:26S proteasome regulatory subunit T6